MNQTNNDDIFFIIYKKYISTVNIIKKNKFKILIISLLFGVLGFFLTPKKNYLAETTLFFNVSKQSKLFNLVNSFGSLGVTDIGFLKFKNVAFSNLILNQVLNTEININNEKKKVIYFYIDNLKNSEKYKNINLEIDGFVQDSIKIELVNSLKKSIDVNEDKNELISLTFNHKNQELAKHINDIHFLLIKSFFLKIQNDENLQTLKILQNKKDSIHIEILKTEDILSRKIDLTKNLVKHKGLVDVNNYERKLRILNEMLLEIIKQYELVNFKHLDNKDLIIKLDSPKLPLNKMGRSRLVTCIIFVFLGIIFSVTVISILQFLQKVKKKYRDSL